MAAAVWRRLGSVAWVIVLASALLLPSYALPRTTMSNLSSRSSTLEQCLRRTPSPVLPFSGGNPSVTTVRCGTARFTLG